ncbi:MAG TPA: fibronectin type III domain-containing protein, partial [Patescibacteria group bacterium]|nr:fibronectin type III domain-containing protein [Patescibacteria group bacterium]
MQRIFVLFVLFFLLLPQTIFAQQLPPEQKNISVTAEVGPQARDYQLSISSPTTTHTLKQETIVHYIITYGASSSAAFTTPLTITANWKASDAQSNLPILDYVAGSGSKGYGNTTPIVDLTSRTITWNLPAIPAGTVNQQISFDVKINTNYTGANAIPFTIRATMANSYMTKPEVSLAKEYNYDEDFQFDTNPTPTPTPSIAQTVPPVLAPPTSSLITNFSFTTITDDTTSILIDTNKTVQARIMYGTSSRSLTQSISTPQSNLRNRITIDDLKPATIYYFRILLKDQAGAESTSEIFTFTTAESSVPPDVTDNIIVMTSGGNILLSDIQRTNGRADSVALLTPDTDYEVNYVLSKPLALQKIEAIVRTKVLGLTSQVYASDQTTTIVIPMIEKSPSSYVASLKSLSPGLFEVSVRITDIYGNINEQKVAELKIMSYLTILEEGTTNPISESRVFFTYYTMQTKQFEPLPPHLFINIDNPSYSDETGVVKINLPAGTYQAAVNAFGYTQQEITFTLGAQTGEDFPTIFLHKDPANPVGYLQYYGNAVRDLFTNMSLVVNNLATNVRFFNLIATFIITITIFFTFVFFVFRTRVYPRHLFPYVSHHLKTITRGHPLGTFCAIITDEQGKRIKDALISVLDDKTGELMTSILSNTIGICYIYNPKEHKNLKL